MLTPSYDGLIEDLDLELPEEDTYNMQNENSITAAQPESVQSATADEDEETAGQVLLEWFDRHPLMQDIRIRPVDEYAGSDSGKYLIYEIHMGQEGYGVLYVNPDNGDMVMDSVIDGYGNETSVQIPIEQWYLEYYWGWTDDSGYYLEEYSDDLYIIYDETDIEILEYHVKDDRYFICNWDGNCSVEYADDLAKSTFEEDIMEFAGTFGCDMSFEVEGQ